MESRLSKSPPTRCRSTPTPSAPWFADLSRARYHPDSGPHMRGNPEQHYDTANSRGHQRLQRDRLDRWNVSGIWKFLRLTPETRPLPAPSPFRSCSVSAETQVLREGLKLLEGEQFRSVKLRRLTDQVRNGTDSVRRLERLLNALNERHKDWFYGPSLIVGHIACAPRRELIGSIVRGRGYSIRSRQWGANIPVRKLFLRRADSSIWPALPASRLNGGRGSFDPVFQARTALLAGTRFFSLSARTVIFVIGPSHSGVLDICRLISD